MSELLPGLAVVAAMILMGGLLFLSGCTSTGQWSADMVVPKVKGKIDTRQVVPLDSPPRSVIGWECNNAPLFMQPGGNAFVSKGVLRSLRRNFSPEAKGLLKASGDWSVTDYGLWNTTCVHYSGIVSTIQSASLAAAPLPSIGKVPAGAPSSLMSPNSVAVSRLAPEAQGSPRSVPRIEPWMTASNGRISHRSVVKGARTEPGTVPPGSIRSSRKTLLAKKAQAASVTPPGVALMTRRSRPAQKVQAGVPRIESWMTPEEAEISHDFGRSGEESVVVGSPSGGGSRTASSEVASVSHPVGVSSSAPKTSSSSNVKSRPSPVREASVAIPVTASVTASAQKKIQLAQNPQSRVPRIEPWMTPEEAEISHDF
ncbi:MAG: hypothetical protein ACYDBP_15370, partial [Leptospirales bacterium]